MRAHFNSPLLNDDIGLVLLQPRTAKEGLIESGHPSQRRLYGHVLLRREAIALVSVYTLCLLEPLFVLDNGGN